MPAVLSLSVLGSGCTPPSLGVDAGELGAGLRAGPRVGADAWVMSANGVKYLALRLGLGVGT